MFPRGNSCLELSSSCPAKLEYQVPKTPCSAQLTWGTSLSALQKHFILPTPPLNEHAWSVNALGKKHSQLLSSRICVIINHFENLPWFTYWSPTYYFRLLKVPLICSLMHSFTITSRGCSFVLIHYLSTPSFPFSICSQRLWSPTMLALSLWVCYLQFFHEVWTSSGHTWIRPGREH